MEGKVILSITNGSRLLKHVMSVCVGNRSLKFGDFYQILFTRSLNLNFGQFLGKAKARLHARVVRHSYELDQTAGMILWKRS